MGLTVTNLDICVDNSPYLGISARTEIGDPMQAQFFVITHNTGLRYGLR